MRMCMPGGRRASGGRDAAARRRAGALRRAQRGQLWRQPVAQAHVHLGRGAGQRSARLARAAARVPLAAADHQPAGRCQGAPAPAPAPRCQLGGACCRWGPHPAACCWRSSLCAPVGARSLQEQGCVARRAGSGRQRACLCAAAPAPPWLLLRPCRAAGQRAAPLTRPARARAVHGGAAGRGRAAAHRDGARRHRRPAADRQRRRAGRAAVRRCARPCPRPCVRSNAPALRACHTAVGGRL